MATSRCRPSGAALFYGEPGSYRDRQGRVFYRGGEVFRAVTGEACAEWESLRSRDFFTGGVERGEIIRTETATEVALADIPVPGPWQAVLRHERVPFVSYPYEWSFGMLREAAQLSLRLLASALAEDFLIKDGTAYNVQWVGARPVFIDVLSFRRLLPGEPWPGYRQFCQTFLYPLFLQAYKQVPFQPWLRGSLDGIEPDACRRLMSARDMFRPGVLTHVVLHAQLQSRFADTDQNVRAGLPAAGFNRELIEANVRKLTALIAGLEWRPRQSEWSNYAQDNTYSPIDQACKFAFVEEAVLSRSWRLVWDLGSNTGTYSRLAARNADCVVAMDGDHAAVEKFHLSLRAERNHKILPLVVNLVDASPNLGWRGAERKSLADRGRPDLTLCLALIHHLVIGAGIPLADLLDWLCDLGTAVVIEFVTKADPMVQRLLRNKADDYSDYELENFERCLGERFEIIRRAPLQSGTRVLYFAAARA